MIAIPQMVSWQRWQADTAFRLSPLGTVPIAIPEARWRDFASTVVALPAVAALLTPSPHAFRTWQEWGTRLLQALSTIGV